jgi:NAD(P)-dependent dehydrogenase (short-subunit alcohol dehydrogenase family)
MTAFWDVTPDYPALLRLDDRHVIVFGGGQGIGRQTCNAAASAGARVSVIDRDPELAALVAEEVNGLALSGDVTRRADVERVVAQAVAHFGPLHGLADIVGISTWESLAEVTDESFTSGIEANLRHVFLALQVAAPQLTAGASMVFVGSISGIRAAPNHGVYGAAKAALMQVVATAAIELAPAIRVNAVAPGQTATPRIARRHPEPDYYQRAGEPVPLGRVGRPSDIAAAILFFLSDLSQWVTGQTLVVDGGVSRKFPYDV